MSIQTRKARHNTFPQQGATLGWVLWALLCALALLGLSRDARAGALAPTQTTFASTTVGQTSAPVVVTLTPTASGTASAPAAVTEGTSTAAFAEFTVVSTGTCGPNPNLVLRQSCTVSVTFTPRFPGIRHGAVVIRSSGGQLLASTLLSGLGEGGLPVLIPGQIDTVAGNGQWFYQQDGVPATQASIYLPSGLAVDGAGDLYLADTINNRVRRVDATTHIITTVAGNGSAGFNGDNGPATAAELTGPSGLALDGAGNLFIADTGNDAIRRVDAVSGTITTVAGTLGQSGYTGDGGPATAAKLNAPQGIALTPAGDILIADTTNAAVRALTFSDGSIQTIAGTGTAGYNGDNRLATSAQLNDPSGIAIRPDGTIAVADLSNNRVRLFTVGGNITTIAGNGNPGYLGDGGAPTQAQLQGPAAVAFDPAGDLIIADSVNNCIRLVSGTPATISTLSGNPSDDRYAGDGGPENQARMHGPDGLFFDAGGNLWLSDRFNNRVREVSGSLLTIGPYPTMKVGKTSQPVAEAMINGGNQPLRIGSPALQQAALDPATTTCSQTSLDPGSSCSMGVQFAPTSVGPSIYGSVTWNSDAPNVTPVDQLNGQVLSVEPTSVAITSSANPGLLGQSILLKATVTSDDTGRTGTVDFVEGGTTWCSAVQLGADGTASCAIPSLSLGNHNFVADYSGDNNNAASQSPVFAEVMKQQAALALNVSTSPATVTSNVTLTISAADTYGTPTGTVVFYDGATALATVTLDNNGHASWSTSSFTVGTHSLSAQYSGDSSNVPGASNTKSLEVDQASTTTVLSSGNNDATVGASVTLTADVVSNNGPAPTGTVHFLDGQTDLGSGTLTANGTASVAVSTLAPGSHTLTAVYSGDTDSATSTSAPVTQTIEQIGTATTLGADVDPLSAGAAVHLTAIVSLSPGAAADGTLTGTVAFHEGSSALGTASINATGQATLALPSLAVGTHLIVATFSGSTNYATSSSTPLSESVQQTATNITLSSASSTTLMGKAATFSVTVTSSTGIPTGTVSFKDNATVLGSSSVDAHGNASFSTSSMSAGNHLITAAYSGDSNYLASTSAGVQQTVVLAQTTLVLSGPVGAIDAGTSAQFTATLSTPGITPTGSLLLLDGPAIIATQPVTVAGTFTFSTSRLGVGAHQLTASYSGDTDNAAVTSAGLSVTVQQAHTTTTLVSSANPLTQGVPLSLTATVASDSPGEGNTLSFYDGSTLLGTAPLNAQGQATFTPQSLSLGSHPLTATYSGDTNHAGSTSATLSEQVVQDSSIALTSSANPSVSGQNIIFTAQMKGNPLPTGSAAFRDSSAVLATVPLDSTGTASLAIASLAVGTHAISVTYSGDSNFSTATAQLTQTVLN
ncbi:MAG TPA: Ig-like domain repeat protein, partial [Acidobacteriaceae bacterium]|nr:Ig-like domain repeat protein [Acidobacteriaceae bacterium]